MTTQTDFIVDKTNLRNCQWLQTQRATQLHSGQVLLAIDSFAFTANNITYAVAGDSMSYWRFFPTQEGWGRIPVWGYADVVESANSKINVGERVYGYFPMSSHLLVNAAGDGKRSWYDQSEHRSSLSRVYNQYLRTEGDPSYSAENEAAQMLFRPLFMTSFLIDDFLSDNNFFGASQIVITSASSKTSIGLAHTIHRNRAGQCKAIGLTSHSNLEFVKSLGIYDEVVTYDNIESIHKAPTISVDMAGNGSVLMDLHRHLADQLQYSCLVGVTHWEARQGAQQLPGPKPELFFAPSRIEKRNQDWGSGVLDSRLAEAWQHFIGEANEWIKPSTTTGKVGVEDIYQLTLAGKARADTGYILSVVEQ